jgi:ABC-2 type transport system permease protein
MTVLFSSIFFGAYVVWDKKLDFLKGVLVSPQSRTTIFVGKAFGGVTDSLIEVSVLMLVGIAMGIPLTALSVGISYLILLFFIIGTVSLGLVIGSQMESPQGFGLISSFVVFPMFLLSGALYPLSNLPGWLVVLTRINPATYAVDGLRSMILGSSLFPLVVDVSTIILFTSLMIALGTYAFNRMRV